MTIFRISLILILSLCAQPLTAQAWSGPQVTLANKNGRKVIKICDQSGAPCVLSTPFFLALNSNAAPIQTTPPTPRDWSTFMYQARLHLAYVAASNGVAPMLQVHVRNISNGFLDELAAQLNQLSPRPYLYVRLDLRDAPTLPGFESVKMRNLQGQTVNNPANNVRQEFGKGSNWAFNEAWLAYEESEIARVLNRLDSQYPGRVMGINLAYENAGEWMYRPYGWDPAQGKMLDWDGGLVCANGSDGLRYCNLLPWTNDSSAPPRPAGRHQYYLNDYSTTTETGFCAWTALPAVLRSGCRAASVAERNNANPNLPLPGFGQARGAFLDPADTGSLRGAYYNRYIAYQKVNAITRLAAHAKQISGNRVLTSAFYGYIMALRAELAISGHAALTQLLASNAIDLIIGPYSYLASRSLGNPVVPHAPSDAPPLANKLWIDEDDSRTLFTPPGDVFKTVDTLWDSIRLLRRNLLSVALRNRGSHFFDLPGQGWFGQPSRDDDSQALWANLTVVFNAIDKLQRNAPNRFEPQVAVFVDDLSANYLAGLTPAGEETFAFTQDIASDLLYKLSVLGTPVKQYLLSDLLRSNLDLSAIKLAVFSNAWNVPDNLRQAITSKLKTPGRTLLFVYASGYLNGDAAASAANISALTGITVAQGSGTPSLAQSFTINGQTFAGGPSYGLTPWFRIGDPLIASILGTYTSAGGISAATKNVAVAGGSYKAALAAAPNVPLAMLRKLSEDAGVHHFMPAGDTVETAGNLLLVHAATANYKTITFPATLPRLFETATLTSDTLLCSYCSSLTQLAFNAGDTRVFRWTSPPLGNFELISSGPTLEGWALDFDAPASSVDIHVYRNGPPGVGTFHTSFNASLHRPDLTAAFGVPGNSGFRVPIGSCPSGTQLFAYAIDPEPNGDSPAFIGTHTCP